MKPSWTYTRYGSDHVDYRDWEAASPEQRRLWNCALDHFEQETPCSTSSSD